MLIVLHESLYNCLALPFFSYNGAYQVNEAHTQWGCFHCNILKYTPAQWEANFLSED